MIVAILSVFPRLGNRQVKAEQFSRCIPLFSACVTLILALLVTARIPAQNSQFFFDPNGNLLLQKSETTAAPQILGQPQNRIVQPGEATSFFVVAADTRALTYEWRFNGVPLGGSATNDALLSPNVSTNNEGEHQFGYWMNADATRLEDAACYVGTRN